MTPPIRSRRWLVASAALLALLFSQGVAAGPVADHLKATVDRALKSLDDLGLKADTTPEERRQAFREIGNTLFDWTEMARRSLGRHWQTRTPGEREEFAALLGGLLEHAYLSKIERYGGAKILYTGETVEGDQATVRTKAVSKQGQEVPIDYRMIQRGERWLVYDVVIEGISLVSNYRTQFDKIIQASSYQELVRRLKAQSRS